MTPCFARFFRTRCGARFLSSVTIIWQSPHTTTRTTTHCLDYAPLLPPFRPPVASSIVLYILLRLLKPSSPFTTPYSIESSCAGGLIRVSILIFR